MNPLSYPLVSTSSADTESNDEGSALTKQLFDDSGVVTSPPPQPRCWFNALKVFSSKEKEEIETLNQMCATMGPQEQQAFAFEIARCHLAEMGRSIVETIVGLSIDNVENCTAFAVVATCDNGDRSGNRNDEDGTQGCFPNLKKCLKNLTQDGVNAYTYFYTQVIQLCNRLTEHLVAEFQKHTSIQLAKFSQQAVAQFNYLVQRQQDAFEEREKAIHRRHEDFYSSMKNLQQEMFERQNSRVNEFKTWTSDILNDWSARAQYQKELQEAWLVNQTNYLESKAAEWGRQSWFSVTGWLNSSLKLDKLYNIAVDCAHFLAIYGPNLCAFLFHLGGILYIAYILTLPRRCRRLRVWIFSIIFMEGFAELSIIFGMENEQVSASYQKSVIATLRNSAFWLETLIYAVGLVCSCCSCGRSHGTLNNNENTNENDYHSTTHHNQDQLQTPSKIGTGTPTEVPSEVRHRTLLQAEFRRLMNGDLGSPPPQRKHHQQQVAISPPSTTPHPIDDDNSGIPLPPPIFMHRRSLDMEVNPGAACRQPQSVAQRSVNNNLQQLPSPKNAPVAASVVNNNSQASLLNASVAASVVNNSSHASLLNAHGQASVTSKVLGRGSTTCSSPTTAKTNDMVAHHHQELAVHNLLPKSPLPTEKNDKKRSAEELSTSQGERSVVHHSPKRFRVEETAQTPSDNQTGATADDLDEDEEGQIIWF